MKRRFSLTAQLTGMIELLMVGFSAVVLALFLMSARSLLLRHFESSLQRDAYVIAKELALSLDRSQEETLYARTSGSGAFSSLMLYEELTHADIWVVDGQHTIYTHQNDAPNILRGERLPAILEALTAQAFLGQNGFSSGSIGGRTMLCGSAPMTDAHGDIFAVVVMASPLDERVSMGPELTALLLSMAAALALMCAVCVIFARSFLRPIKRMNRTAHTLAGGDYTAVTGISRRDEIVELAASMDALAQRLEEARQERERTELEKQEFLRRISHELKTPISIIRGSLEAFAEGVIAAPDAQRQTARQMLSEILCMQKLVGELLDLTRLQTTSFQLDFAPVDMGELLGDVLMSARVLAGRKGQTVVCAPPEQPCPVTGDYDRLRQLLMILIDNAVRYAPEGSTITLTLDMPACTLSVADEGPGIAPELQQSLFVPYARGKAFESTGLGLAIAHEIAVRHGYELTVTSAPGQGSVFALRFVPAQSPEA